MSIPLSYRMERTLPASMPMVILASAGFLSVAGARIIDSLLAAIAHDLSTSVPTLSLALAAFTLTYGLNQLILGPLADRAGKLRIVLCALFGYAVATAGCAIAGSVTSLTLLRALAGAASGGLVPFCMAYIADMTAYGDRQAVLGRFLTGVMLAQILAGPLGGIFGDTLGWRGVFLLLAALGLVVGVALAIRMPSLPPGRREARAAGGYRLLLADRWARLLLLGTLIDGMLMTGSFPFVAPYLHDHFALSYGEVGVILALFGVGGLLYSRQARVFVDFFGERGLVLGGGLLMASGMAAAAVLPAWLGFPVIEFMLGLGYFMLHGTLQARSTELLPQARATAISAFVFTLFLGQTLGALASGLLIAHFGYGIAFIVDAAAILALGIWLFRLLRAAPVRFVQA